MENIDTKLLTARKARNLTLRDLEKKTGISKAILSRIETGKQVPSRAHARILFDFYQGEILLSEIYDPKFFTEAPVNR